MSEPMAPEKTLERSGDSRERKRQQYAVNRERLNAQARARYAADPEKYRARMRADRAKDPAKARARQRAWHAANPDKVRAARRKGYVAQRAGILASKMLSIHGLTAEAWAAMWDAQDGRCYLCRRPLDKEQAVVDHDHSCCGPKNSCRFCRRGLACRMCNVLIGCADDDPGRLRLIADNLEVAIRTTVGRRACRPLALPLWGDGEASGR